MKKQNILKKISLLVLSSIMTASGVLAKAGETVAKGKHDKDPAYPKLTTKDAGKNPTTKTKKSSENVSVTTVLLTSIGVLWTINKTHDLISALFGNPNFKIGMMIALSNYYNKENKLLRGSLLNPDRDLTYILRHFQRKTICDENEYVIQEKDETNNKKSIEDKTQTAFPIFKGIVTKMTADEIDDLIEKGKEFAESHPEISKLLLKRFDVLLIDAFDSAAEKISSLFSPKSEYNID